MARDIYLDYNATAPVKPAVAEVVAETLGRIGNASSVHGFGRHARRTVEDARERVSALVSARPEHIVFTSGGTEANAMALRGTGRLRHVVGATEHVSVLHADSAAHVAPVDARGILVLDKLARLLAQDDEPAIVSVMLANNETGVIQPIAQVSELARRHGALVHCDAVQAAGKIAIDVRALGVDLLSLSAHKFGGPQGIGALVVDDRLDLDPLLRGGGQERKRRAGTENVAAIAGFGVAAELGRRDMPGFEHLAKLRAGLEDRIRSAVAEVRIFGSDVDRLPNTSCLTMPGVASETQVMAFDLADVAVSAGSACSSGKVEPSHVLDAMGIDEEEADTALRVSLGWRTEAAEIDHFVDTWCRIYGRVNARAERVASAA